MYPVLFSIGRVYFYSYGLCISLAFGLGALVVYRAAHKSGLKITPEKMIFYAFFILIFAMIGARIYYVVFSLDKFKWTLYHILAFWKGGFGFYGGLLLGLGIGLYLIYKNDPQNIYKWLDSGILGITIGISIGRIGCFLNGCCYGIPTTLPWGVTFTNPASSAFPLGVSLHPTQIYESLIALLIFGILILLYKLNLKLFSGFLFLLGIILYAIGRFLIEYLRGDSLYLGNFRIAQVISIIIIAVGGYILIRKVRIKLVKKI
jgi:phosphatidylglycerol:prolipoprotein diacylglycerol transferase